MVFMSEPDEVLNQFATVLEHADTIYTTGIGKSAHVARYFADVLTSIGKPSFFIDPVSAVHGDLGRLAYAAPVVVFTNSGATEELRPFLVAAQWSNHFLFVTGQRDYPLKEFARISITIGSEGEGNRLGFPGDSIVKSTMFCAAMTAELAERLDVTEKEYKVIHPGGAIGKRLSNVRENNA